MHPTVTGLRLPPALAQRIESYRLLERLPTRTAAMVALLERGLVAAADAQPEPARIAAMRAAVLESLELDDPARAELEAADEAMIRGAFLAVCARAASEADRPPPIPAVNVLAEEPAHA